MDRRTIVLLFLATSFLFVSPGLWPGNAYGPSDILTLGAPFRDAYPLPPDLGNSLQNDQVEQLPFVIEFWTSLRRGEIQLWEPDLGGGVPLFTSVYNRILAPWNVAFLVVPVAKAAALATALAFFVAQLGTYGLARRLGSGAMGAALAGVIYGFSGSSVVFVLRIHEVFLFPVVLFAIHGVFTETGPRRARYLLLLSISFAFLLLCGFPAVALIAVYISIGWLVYMAFAVTAGRRRWSETFIRAARASLTPVLALLAGVALAAVQLLPSYEFLRVSEALERAYPLSHRIGLESLATTVSGRFFGTYRGGGRWGRELVANPVEGSLTVGAVALILILLTIVRPTLRGRDPQMARALRRFFLPVGLFVMVAAYMGGVALGLIHTLPFMEANSFGRARFFVALTMALAAGHSFDALGASRNSSRKSSTSLRVQLAALLGLIAVGSYEAVTLAMAAGAGQQVLAALIVPAIAASVAAILLVLLKKRRDPRIRPLIAVGIIAVAAAELQWGGWNFTPPSPVETFYERPGALSQIAPEVGSASSFRFLGLPHSTLRPNAAAVWDVLDVRAAWPTDGRFRDLLRTVDPGVYEAKRLKPHFTDQFSPSSPVLDAMGVRYLVTSFTTSPFEVERVDSSTTLRRDRRGLRMDDVPSDPVRAIALRLDDVGPCDLDGHIVLDVQGTRTRRIVRDRSEWTTFFLPDLVLHENSEVRLSSPGCPLRIIDDEVRLHKVASGATTRVTSVDSWVLYERVSALPRVALAQDVAVIPDSEERLALLAERDSGSPIVVEEGVSLQPDPHGDASIVEADDDRIVISVTSDRDALLVLRDVAVPGWTATVNGSPTDVLRADHAFRGVVVPSGRSQVVFEYEPRSLKLGFAFMLIGLLPISFWFWRGFVRRGSRRRRPTGACAS